MPKPSPTAERFIQRYTSREAEWRAAAIDVDRLLHELLDGCGFDLHLISCRAKSKQSATMKILAKGYRSPSVRMTDIVGARVITYYADRVDSIVDQLKKTLTVHLRKSEDKRRRLDVRQFGYRSVHLVCQANGGQLIRYPDLGLRMFELQVRSLLEHSWAETEHEIVYKSGVKYPESVTRRFSTMAAALELVDDQYIALREREAQLAVEYSERYRIGFDLDTSLDAARLVGYLEAFQSKRPGWKAGKPPASYAPKLAARGVAALSEVGVRTANELSHALKAKPTAAAIRRFGAGMGIPPSEVSQLALVLLVTGLADRGILELYFPNESQDPSLASALGVIARARSSRKAAGGLSDPRTLATQEVSRTSTDQPTRVTWATTS